VLSNYIEAVEGPNYLFDIGRLMPRYDEKERRIFTHSLVFRERDGQLSGTVFVAALAEDFDLTALGFGKQLDALVYLTRKRFVQPYPPSALVHLKGSGGRFVPFVLPLVERRRNVPRVASLADNVVSVSLCDDLARCA
jgi:hypothetical protein